MTDAKSEARHRAHCLVDDDLEEFSDDVSLEECQFQASVTGYTGKAEADAHFAWTDATNWRPPLCRQRHTARTTRT